MEGFQIFPPPPACETSQKKMSGTLINNLKARIHDGTFLDEKKDQY